MKFSIRRSSGVYVEKRSRFLSFLEPLITEEQHKSKLKELKKQFYEATHICFALRVMKDHQIFERSSDAGEPSGSAGKPILNILKSQEIIQMGLYVVRYYGGTPLGIPGLVHSYGQSALLSIEGNDSFQIFVEYEKKHEKIPFSHFQVWKNQLEKIGGKIIHMKSGDGVEVEYEIPTSSENSIHAPSFL